MMCLQIGVCEETCADGLETSVRNRKEDTPQVDNIAWVHQPGKVAIDMDCHGPGNMADRYLVSLDERRVSRRHKAR